ncbi:uncharacterized protein LOC129572640 [Sitodiplosis mosellana]|uniref:uncharacterized protein LOC129572640 n=1 Tax=Sitodiplosis mosellana TaxID=263140 RepID=UPI002443A8AD|nr:uncharacterized protein LOC129572640 [Sitodiplosis mosellana]
MEENDVFDTLEHFSGIKFPLCIKTLLRYAAYESKSSCMLLDVKTVAEMEDFLAETGQAVIASLDCCNSAAYKNQNRFRFLPGHKTCILSIPDQLRNMDAVKRKKSKPMLEFKKLMTSTELKHLLLMKLNQSAVKYGFASEAFDESHLNDVQTIILNNDLTAKCTVQCFQCRTTINALYKGSWTISNVLRHVKIHQPSEDTVDQSQNENGTENIVTVHSSPLDLIEEEAIVAKNNEVVTTRTFKRVQLGNGKSFLVDMAIHPR